jgi:hypothetical protein
MCCTKNSLYKKNIKDINEKKTYTIQKRPHENKNNFY